MRKCLPTVQWNRKLYRPLFSYQHTTVVSDFVMLCVCVCVWRERERIELNFNKKFPHINEWIGGCNWQLHPPHQLEKNYSETSLLCWWRNPTKLFNLVLLGFGLKILKHIGKSLDHVQIWASGRTVQRSISVFWLVRSRPQLYALIGRL
jgi:hypothetical protein